MYLPASFEERDRDKLLELIERYPFATLVTPTSGRLWISHVPLLIRRRDDEVVLAGHVARANEHWRHLGGEASTTAVFHGPHAYVSPAWYAKSPAVPTWNYAVVHVTGRVRVDDDPAAAESLVRELTVRHEGARRNGWTPESLPDDFRRNLVAAIVAFELRAETIEGKLKLSQNRCAEDRQGVISALEDGGDDTARALVEMMRAGREQP
jgi:transcriptional regulator